MTEKNDQNVDPGTKTKPKSRPGLKNMKKDGEKIAVHKSCVAAHERVGWVLCK